MTRPLLALLTASALLACEPGPAPADGGVDAGGGQDAGADAGLPPLELTFQQVTLPAAPSPVSLVSDGTTLYALSTIGSVAQGTLQSVVLASVDEGLSFQVRSLTAKNALEPTPDGGVYGLDSRGLGLSVDGARTFVAVATPVSLDFASGPHLHVTADGAVWLTSRNAPFVVERSVDDGATFTPVPVPADTTRLEPCRTRGDRFVALRNDDELIASDGATFTSLGSVGPLTGARTCFVTPAGTVLVTAGVATGIDVLRLPVGATTWERTATGLFFRYAVSGSTLVRSLTTGRLDVSTDEGATWTTRTGSTPEGAVLSDVAFAGATLVARSPGATARLPAGASAWELVVPPGLPPFLRVVDLAFATRTPAAALLLEDNVQHTLYVAEDGATWRRGRTLPRGAATALALSPDGTQALLGAADGTYRVFADAGTTLVIDSRIETAIGQRDTNPIRQAVWDEAQGSVVLVTTGNDAATAGSVWQLSEPETGNRTWVERRPTSTTTSAAVRPGAYGALCLSAEAPAPALTRSLVVSLRSNVSANSFLTSLLTRQPAFASSAAWLQDTPPVGFSGALAAACNGAWGGGLALLWPEQRLWVGRFADALREVPLPAGLGDAKVVRFDRAGRLWLGTAGGLWRTATPVTLD